jgi:hypothetical protein
MPTSSSG